MTFWQGIVINLLAESTDILSSGGEKMTTSAADDEDTYAKSAQNFLICLEMLGFAIAHFYCFPVEEWEEGYRPTEDKSKFGDNMALGDFVQDLKLILKHKSKKKRRSKKKVSRSNSGGSMTMPEEDEQDEEVGSLLDDVTDLLLEDDSPDVSPKPSPVTAKKTRSIIDETSADQIESTSLGSEEIDEESQGEDLPYELRQARALLLESNLLDDTTANLLTNDMLNHLSNELEASGDNSPDRGFEQYAEEDEESEEIYVEENQPLEPARLDEEEVQLHSEPSRLFSTSTDEEMLQPSIFTMHSKSSEE